MRNISLYRLNGILLLLISTMVILYYGKSFLVPLFFAILCGMLLLPVCNWLEKKGVSRIWSTLSGLLIILSLIGVLIGIVAAQGTSLAEDWPRMQQKAIEIGKDIQDYIQTEYGVSISEQDAYLQKGVDKVSKSGGGKLGGFFSGFLGILTGFVLVLLYFFFLMWKREKYEEFILKLVRDENRKEVKKELNQITKVASQYLVGRLISMAFLAVFYMIGFSIVGLPNGLLVALVAVIPTIIPYVGAFVGGFFPLAIAIIGGTPDMIWPVAAILIVAQVIDNNIIEPLAEGESLHISPIFTIVAIVLGEWLWGVAGMILFIPMFAILKIVCDHIPSLHPFSYLLNNELPEPKWMKKIKNLFKKKKS